MNFNLKKEPSIIRRMVKAMEKEDRTKETIDLVELKKNISGWGCSGFIFSGIGCLSKTPKTEKPS